MQEDELADATSIEVGRRVREELARRRISRQALADMARISLSTLEKALAGTRPFTLASTIRIEEALGTALRPGPAAGGMPSAAPDHLGAYSRSAVRWLEGSYLTIRPSFATPGNIFTYVTDIHWLDEPGHLGFAEQQRLDAQFEQRGAVSLPNQSGHIYLVTEDCGQHRLAVLGRPTISGTMFGILTTLQVGQGSQLVPATCPLVLAPLAKFADMAIGTVTPGMPGFGPLRALLTDATAKDFARFHL